MRGTRHPSRWVWGALVCWLVLGTAPARSGVSVAFDLQTLNELLPALTVDAIALPVGEGHSFEVLLEELEVTGFDPSPADGGPGHIVTSLTVRIPQLGLAVPLKPRLSLRVNRRSSGDELELRFERAEIQLPLAGGIDVAPFLPPLSFPAENLFLVAGARGNVQVHSRLTAVKMGQKVVRLEFDLETVREP